MNLNSTHFGCDSRRINHDGAAHLNPAGNQRARDDGSKTFDGKDAVNRQAEQIRGGAFGDFGGKFIQRLDKFRKAFPGYGRNRCDRSVLQKSAPGKIADIIESKLQPLFIHHINFGYGHHAVFHAQQGAYLHVLASLGHNALVGCDNHNDDINSGSPGHHVFYKFFMPRHIDDAQMLPAGKIKGGESEFNGNAPFFFLL